MQLNDPTLFRQQAFIEGNGATPEAATQSP